MTFKPNALPTLIGSLPVSDHEEATDIILRYMKEIPLWAQLPCYPEERLLSQFAEGLPGIKGQGDSLYFDTDSPAFDQELLAFYEAYMEVTEGKLPLKDSIFAFSERTGKGFKVFLKKIAALDRPPTALKGQITGPFTMLTGLKDKEGRLSYFNPLLRDAVIKALTLKARYQAEEMQRLCPNVMVFLDEPALSGFGSSTMVGIGRQDVIDDLTQVIEELHGAGALSGVHVCANTDWSLVLNTPVDILSFDAYGFFDRILLFKEELKDFMERDKIIAWGLVPTLNQEDLKRENVAGLKRRWEDYNGKLGTDPDLTKRQALITPSCGTGLLTRELSIKALELTRDLSMAIRDSREAK